MSQSCRPGVEPLVELVGDLRLHGRASAAAAAGQPPPQRLLEVGQAYEVVLRRSELGLLSGQDRHRIGEVGRAVGSAADLAVVPVLIRRAAARARALDIAIRQEHPLHRVVRLGDVLACDVAGLLQVLVDQLRARSIFPASAWCDSCRTRCRSPGSRPDVPRRSFR